jgi:DNA-binding NtrC family response regulator
MDPAALTAIQRRSFPGNLRELRNLVERAALLAEGPAISDLDLGMERTVASWQKQAAQTFPQHQLTADDEGSLTSYHEAKRTAQDAFESSYLIRLLRRTDGNLSRAAALAGIERQNLRALLKKHGLYRPRSSQ